MSIVYDLIHLIIRLVMWLVFLRFWLQWAGANFYNPISEIITKLSEPFCKPFRIILPYNKRYDWGSLLALLALSILFWLIHYSFVGIISVQFNILIIRAITMAFEVMLNALFMVLIIRAIASWVAPAGHNPALEIFVQLTEPLLRPIRRVIPPTSGIDLSFVVLWLIVWLALRILHQL